MSRINGWDGIRIAFGAVLIALALKVAASGIQLHVLSNGDLTIDSIPLSFLAIALAVLISAGDSIARVFSDASTRELTTTVDEIRRTTAETASKVDRLLETARGSPSPKIVIDQNSAMSPQVVINGADGSPVEQSDTSTVTASRPDRTAAGSLPPED